MNPSRAALCGVAFSKARNKGTHAAQAKISQLCSGKVRVSNTPLKADKRKGLISLSVRYFTGSGLQYYVD